MSSIFTRLGRYYSEYLNSSVIFVMDVFLSLMSSLVVLFTGEFLPGTATFSSTFTAVYLCASLIFSAVMFFVVKSYRVIIRHSTMRDVAHFVAAMFGKVVLMGLVLMSAFSWDTSTLIILSIDFLVSLFAVLIIRVLMVLVYEGARRRHRRQKNCLKVLVFGTSDKSVALVARLSQSPHYRVVGFLSDSEQRITLSDLPVTKCTDERSFLGAVAEYGVQGILFATEKEATEMQSSIIRYAVHSNIKVLLSPIISEVEDGHVSHDKVREIKIEDLLGRKEIKISEDEIIDSLKGKTVLVTGAAGSIGSELCRQLAGFGVGKLLLFDNAETPMHNLRLELEETFPSLGFVPIIGDVRHPERLDFVFRSHHPEVVFHAAAYKHVPLMEENPCEAVLVNVAGSRNVADKCVEYGTGKMVMISTDKAVNPTNIMGCTKRLAEIYVQSLGRSIEAGETAGKTKFVTTRFGNVLGSNGSVIPRFRKQIAEGGPVTVTHKDIIRFFMTIPEACRLVMEAAVLPTDNKICVFDMGAPVKIDTLARNMISLAGLTPDKDIKIEYTGLRPGEKLYEEVLSNAENTVPTSHDRIRIATVRDYDYKEAAGCVDRLEKLSREVNIPEMVQLMKKIVPEFISRNSEFEKYDIKKEDNA